MFFGSILQPGPVLVTYLAFINNGAESNLAVSDVEIGIFHVCHDEGKERANGILFVK
jgi:hypothetical protein